MSTNFVCPLCSSTDTGLFLERRSVPVHQNLLMEDRAAARSIARGELRLVVCRTCGFIFNEAFDSSKLQYGNAYDNSQERSSVFQAHLDGLAAHMIRDRELRGHYIVEIGCGRGAFLRMLVEADPGNRAVGYDPSYVGPAVEFEGRLRFERRFFEAGAIGHAPDVLVCRHVIEHVAEPQRLLGEMRKAVSDSPHARVFIETPCAEWILRNGMFWDLFYEHCSYYSTGSLRTALERAGFEFLQSRHVFGQQFLWVEAEPASRVKDIVPAKAQRLVSLAAQYARRDQKIREHIGAFLDELSLSGTVALWGAGAKGVTFANITDPDAKRIASIVDINPNKQGRYLPGTGHPIVAPEELLTSDVQSVVLTNPNYRDEILQATRRIGLDVDVIDAARRAKQVRDLVT